MLTFTHWLSSCNELVLTAMSLLTRCSVLCSVPSVCLHGVKHFHEIQAIAPVETYNYYEVQVLTLKLPAFLRALVWSHESVQPHPPNCTVVGHDTVPHWDGTYDFPTLSVQPVVFKFPQSYD